LARATSSVAKIATKILTRGSYEALPA